MSGGSNDGWLMEDDFVTSKFSFLVNKVPKTKKKHEFIFYIVELKIYSVKILLSARFSKSTYFFTGRTQAKLKILPRSTNFFDQIQMKTPFLSEHVVDSCFRLKVYVKYEYTKTRILVLAKSTVIHMRSGWLRWYSI